MVTRKPVPSPTDSGLAPYPSSPPYPITPTIPKTPQSHNLQSTRQAPGNSAIDSEQDGYNAWRDDREVAEGRPGASRNGQPTSTPIPESLRVGPASLSNSSSRETLRVVSADVSSAISKEEFPSGPSSTNPFSKVVHEGSEGRESSANAWGDVSGLSAQAPSQPPPPIPQNQCKPFSLHARFASCC
jgi:hypothetical protein